MAHQCAAVRKKGSGDQCSAKCVFGHTLCGRHARCKTITLWADVHKSRGDRMIPVQALVRGWLVRTRLSIGGPGVLFRKQVTNDEDLLTCESKDRIHPFEYFGFQENGKVWGFSFPTLWKWCARSHAPINPYTKVPLDIETRKRLHAMWSYRHRHQMTLPEEPTAVNERIRSRWNILCQMFDNYHFGEIHPEQFSNMNKVDYYTVFQFLRDDIQVVIRDTNPSKVLLLRLCARAQQTIHALQADQYILQAVYMLLLFLMTQKDPYNAVFVVLSALYRV